MDAASHTVAMLLADARLPSGGHAFSSGLEPALHGGLAPREARAFLHGRARTTALVDAGAAVVARHAGLLGEPYAPVERAWAARTPSGAARTAARELGRGLLRLARTLWPTAPPIVTLLRSPVSPPRPVVLGAIAAHAGLAPATLVRLSVYDDMACAVAALLKLEPRDPVEGVRLILDACAVAEPFVPHLSALTSPEAIPAAGAPETEAWAEAHAVTNRRLFRA